MNHKSPNHNSQNDLPRCQHYTSSGRRCRYPVSGARSPHCFRHAGRHAPAHTAAPCEPDDALISALPQDPGGFQSAVQINGFLSALLVHLAHNRISARRAAVLAYITNQLLRTLPAIDKELEPQSPDDPSVPTIIWDLPRPQREEDNQPS